MAIRVVVQLINARMGQTWYVWAVRVRVVIHNFGMELIVVRKIFIWN